jgi:2-polyprenyl-3-methyl-5-hydroxy-6-metoxy-1,4-benzoquinol methylase
MYAEDEESIIDGVDNAKEHAKYLKSALTLGEIQVVSIGDFGFGKGILLKEMAKEFKPKRIIAIDPSKEANDKLKKQKWIKQFSLSVQRTTLEELNESKIKKPLDLGICNSIFQYIPTNKVSFAFAKLSRLCKYVYFSVPTKVDYEYMKKELDFIDPYAHVRDKKFYLKSISPHFTIVSLNLLESKVYNRESGFLYEFFRF